MLLSERQPFSKLIKSKTVPTTDRFGLSQYTQPMIGMEVEVENCEDFNNIQHSWLRDEDGSLRNHGQEFIMIPSEPNQVETAIDHLFDEVLPDDAHFSPRTSIHVHMNCRSLTFMQIYNIIITYQCFEDLLYDYAGIERKKSIFCVPVGNTRYYNQLKSCYQEDVLYDGWSKYTGLNTRRLADLGTLEFRHLRGTTDKHVIFTWLHLLYRLYNYAVSQSTADLENHIIEIGDSGDYMHFGHEVFGVHFGALESKNFIKKMAEDLTISKLYMRNITLSTLSHRERT